MLQRVAREHPLVAAEPAPVALLTEFCVDSLLFRLQAWTDNIESWGRIRGDLAVAAHRGLAALAGKGTEVTRA